VSTIDALMGSGTEGDGSCFMLKSLLIPNNSYGSDLVGNCAVSGGSISSENFVD